MKYTDLTKNKRSFIVYDLAPELDVHSEIFEFYFTFDPSGRNKLTVYFELKNHIVQIFQNHFIHRTVHVKIKDRILSVRIQYLMLPGFQRLFNFRTSQDFKDVDVLLRLDRIDSESESQTSLYHFYWCWPYRFKVLEAWINAWKNANFEFIECGIISCLSRQP